MALNISYELIEKFITFSKNTFKRKRYSYVIDNYSLQIPYPIAISISRAYDDVKRVCYFIRGATYIEGKFKGEPVLKTVFLKIYDFIKICHSFSDQSSFDKAHDKLCRELCGRYEGAKGTHEMTYGILQKLVNMTFKYLYIEYRLERDNNLFPRSIEDFLHCPVDRQILGKLRLINSRYFAMINVSNFYFHGKPWSKFSRNDYKCFLNILRNKLKEDVKPLEVDFYLWSDSLSRIPQQKIIEKLFNKKSTPPDCHSPKTEYTITG